MENLSLTKKKDCQNRFHKNTCWFIRQFPCISYAFGNSPYYPIKQAVFKQTGLIYSKPTEEMRNRSNIQKQFKWSQRSLYIESIHRLDNLFRIIHMVFYK